MSEPTDRQWTTAARVALMCGVIVVIGMLGCPWLQYSDEVKLQLIAIIGTVAAGASAQIFGKRTP